MGEEQLPHLVRLYPPCLGVEVGDAASTLSDPPVLRARPGDRSPDLHQAIGANGSALSGQASNCASRSAHSHNDALHITECETK